jgi:maltose-binding protein MalE
MTPTPSVAPSSTSGASATATATGPSPDTPIATPSPSPPPRYNVEGDVHLWLSWAPEELRSLELVIEGFRQEYPGVTVYVSFYPPEEVRAAFERAGESGQPVSLLLGPAEWGPSLFEQGLVRDLSVRITSDLHESIQPLAWSQVAYRGAVVGLPLELQGVVLYRNRALVRSPVGSLEEMLNTAGELRTSEVVEGAALDMGFMYSASQIAPCGGNISFERDTPVLTPESGLCWLSLLSELGSAGPVTFDSDEDRELFVAGKAAWYWDGTEVARELNRELGVGNLVIDPWPRDDERGLDLAGFVWSENIYFAASSSAQETEAAWVFASYLLTRQAQATLAEVHGAGHLPVLKDLRLETDLQTEAMTALLQGVAFPLEPEHTRYMGQIEDAARMVTEGRGEPEFALAVAFEGVEGLFPTPTPEPSPSPGS